MSNKGKKFTAAEKYFIDKEKRYRNEINELKKSLASKLNENAKLKADLNDAQSKIDEQNDWIERLLTYTELSKDEIKDVIAREKKLTDVTLSMQRLLSIVQRFT